MWRVVAREHALTRVRQGFDIEKLVDEFVLLRRVLLELIDEQRLSIDARQAARIADLVDAAISVAVTSYVEARDYAMRRAEAERVSFLAHEIRSPVSAVALALGQMQRAGPLPESHEHAMEVAERNLDQLLALLESVLHFERLGAGNAQPNLSELPLGELLDVPVQTARLAADAKGIGFRAEYDPQALVRVDPELTAAAVRNVFDNAVK